MSKFRIVIRCESLIRCDDQISTIRTAEVKLSMMETFPKYRLITTLNILVGKPHGQIWRPRF